VFDLAFISPHLAHRQIETHTHTHAHTHRGGRVEEGESRERVNATIVGQLATN